MTATSKRTTKRTIGRLTALGIAAGVSVAGLGIGPASADAPAEFSVVDSFTAENPCTGEDHGITINIDIREHLHRNGNMIGRASRTGTTSDGYVMDHGLENFVFNGNVARGTLNDTWRNAAGSIFKAQGTFVAKEDGVVVDRFRLRCVKP